MSDFRIDKITNRDGSAGTQIAGITTFSGTSGIVMPSGNTLYKFVDPNLVTDALILQYDFSNHNSYPGSGNTVYDKVGGHDGTLYNSPTYSSNNGGYLSLSGSDDYIQVPNGTTMRWDNPHSIEFWVYPLGTGDAAQNILEASYSDNMRIQFDMSDAWGTGRAEAWVENATAGDDLRVYNQWFKPGAWHHLVVTRSENLATMYIDGKLDDGTADNGANTGAQNSTIKTALPSNYTGTVYIGRFSGGAGTENFDGYISLFSIYQKSLSKDEVLQNYNAWKGRYQ
tara:strand:- start:61 stop:909 length:849 start_codon:yes stop_codon:yes gene_type:complete